MIDVIQIFKSTERFKKDDYETGKLQLLHLWKESFRSSTGYLENSTLYLPDIGKQEPDLQSAHTVIIQDISGFDPFLFAMPLEKSHQPRWFKDIKKNHVLLVKDQAICFYRLSRSLTFEIFRIEKKQPDTFDLSLNYSENKFAIGIPERDDHKIAEIKLNKPVRYKLNGKSDFTMTGRKQRTFAEYDYLIEYLGQANKIVFKDLKKIETIKNEPNKEYKLVDERKILK